MGKNSLKLVYKLYFEAEDISQTRILSTSAFIKNFVKNCGSTYFQSAQVDDESDLEEFTIRIYIENEIKEDVCSNEEDAKCFLADMMEFLDKLAMAQNYLDMEGSFSIEYEGEAKSYQFFKESGMYQCEFKEIV